MDYFHCCMTQLRIPKVSSVWFISVCQCWREIRRPNTASNGPNLESCAPQWRAMHKSCLCCMVCVGSMEDRAAAVLHPPCQAANPSLSEHRNCLFNWLLHLGERVLCKVPPKIPSTVCFSAVICVNIIGFFSASDSQAKQHLTVISSKSNFLTLLFEEGTMEWPHRG